METEMTMFQFEKNLLTVWKADFRVERRKSRFKQEVTRDMETI